MFGGGSNCWARFDESIAARKFLTHAIEPRSVYTNSLFRPARGRSLSTELTIRRSGKVVSIDWQKAIRFKGFRREEDSSISDCLHRQIADVI